MNKPDALTLVIFGASGDLTRRKLMPALYLLYKAGRLPRRFAVLGMARTSYDDDLSVHLYVKGCFLSYGRTRWTKKQSKHFCPACIIFQPILRSRKLMRS